VGKIFGLTESQAEFLNDNTSLAQLAKWVIEDTRPWLKAFRKRYEISHQIQPGQTAIMKVMGRIKSLSVGEQVRLINGYLQSSKS
jgi:hypothetical protein